MPGRWTVRRESGAPVFQVTQTNTPGGTCLFKAPASAAGSGGKLIVAYENLSAAPTLVAFDPEDGLTLFLYSAPFESNLARALLAILIRLAFFAALGVTAGSLFSMPVASFVAVCGLLMMQISGYLQSVAGKEIILHSHGAESHGPTIWDHFFGAVFKAFSAVVSPLQSLDPLELLTTGQLVTWTWLGSLFLVQVCVYGGALMLISAWVLNKRELALPS